MSGDRLLVKLLPEQVERKWNTLKPLIAEALPPTVVYTPGGMLNLLVAILMDRAQVWAYVEKAREVHAIIVTYIDNHDITGLRQLEIYAAVATRSVTPEKVFFVMEELKRFASFQRCLKIIAYTEDPSLARFLRMHGAKVDFTLVEYDLV